MSDRYPYGLDTLSIPAFLVTDEHSAELKQWQRDHPGWFVAGTWSCPEDGRTAGPDLNAGTFLQVAWPFDRRDNLPLGGSTGSPYYGNGGFGFGFGVGRGGSAPRGTQRRGGPSPERGDPAVAGKSEPPGAVAPEPNLPLRQELERAGRLKPGDGNEAHHLVPKGGPGRTGARDPTAAQEMLEEAKVVLDSVENGVVLSRRFHRRLHTAQHYEFIAESLRQAAVSGGRQRFLTRLRKLLEDAEIFQNTGEMPTWRME